jgi:hypothetical protein
LAGDPDVAGPQPPDVPAFEQDNSGTGFDGVDDFVSVPARILNDLPAFTIMGWVRPTDVTSDLVGLFGQHGVIEFGFATPTTLELWTQNGGTLTVDHNLLDGEWHHVAATGDGQFLRIYIDGVQVGAFNSPTGNYGSSASPFNIGGYGIFDSSGNYFNGEIDEVAVYYRALSLAEIELLTIDMEMRIDYTPLIQTDVTDEMLDIQTTLLMRQEFRVDDPTDFDTLTLTVYYDDGFVAYLNGQEIARANAPGLLEWDSAATQLHPDMLAEEGVEFDVSEFRRNFLYPGQNVLAVHALNIDAANADFLIAVELEGSLAGIASGSGPGAGSAWHVGGVAFRPTDGPSTHLPLVVRPLEQPSPLEIEPRPEWALPNPARPRPTIDWRADDRDEEELEDLLQLLVADRFARGGVE